MKLIVGLGNPGKEYENTRHNMGFMVIDKYVDTNKLGNFKEKFNGLYLDTVVSGERTIFLKPLTYMNLSGESVKKYMDYYKVSIEDILIICDDLDMSIGKWKLKQNSSSGGHNGLKNIEKNIGSNAYKRLKIGIGNNKHIDTKDYVLGKFDKIDIKIIEKELNVFDSIIDDFFKLSFGDLSSKYNGKSIEVEDV